MIYTGTLWHRILFRPPFQVLCAEGERFVHTQGNKRTAIEYLDIQGVERAPGFFWDTLKITTTSDTYLFKGFESLEAASLESSLKRVVASSLNLAIQQSTQSIKPALDALDRLFKQDRYVANYDVKHVTTSLGKTGIYIKHAYFDENLLPDNLKKALKTIISVNRDGPAAFKESNETFIQKEIVNKTAFFNKLEKHPLTSEQQRAVIVNEDRNLLVAAAGSGKSSTIVAKVVYLLDKQLARPDEILVLTYNKDAQLEIDDRLTKLVGVSESYSEPVKSKTFHGYGYEIIAKVNGKAPSISKLASGAKHAVLKQFSDLITDIANKNPTFRINWQLFNLLVKAPLVDTFEFESDLDYKHYMRQLGAEIKEFPDGSSKLAIFAMNGMQVASLEEMRIANWLVLSGVKFEYERKYIYDTATVEKRQYFPDFYYPEADLYHEHFALNKDGKAPPFLTSYEEGVKWKRALHTSRKTKLIETHSADFHSGTVFDKLQKQLETHGVTFNPLSVDKLDGFVKESFSIENDTSLFTGFLRHFKANQLTIDQLRDKASDIPDPIRTRYFINIFEEINKEYQSRLNQEGAIDFEDQIIMAAKHLQCNSYHHPFKYILVDEFQDISQDRRLLLDAMLQQKADAKLFAVGDDWQSIYRFSGSDIDLMTNFPKHFGFTATNYLTKTFRSYQRIVDVATQFIQQNPEQLAKNVSSILIDDKDRVFIRGYQSDGEQRETVSTLLTGINKTAQSKNDRLSVYLLGRYRDCKPIDFDKYRTEYPALDIVFKTIHESKGLEADYVIILSVTDRGKKSFPTSMTDDPLLDLVIPKPESFVDAEERRLMYVALTRAKRAVYVLADQTYRSPFANELASYENVSVPPEFSDYIICTVCGIGQMVKRKGKFSEFMACSKYPDCKHSYNIKKQGKSIVKPSYQKKGRYRRFK